METTVQSIKVVEPNNFLMYMMHGAVIESSVKARGLATLYMFSCIYFHEHTFSVIVELSSPLFFLVSTVVFVLSCLLMHYAAKKKYTRVSSDELCMLFKRFAMDVCHRLVSRVLTK